MRRSISLLFMVLVAVGIGAVRRQIDLYIDPIKHV
jgi:hypothetical protein